MLSYSFDRFYVVTKFILQTMDDLTIDFDSEYSYLNVDLSRHRNVNHYIPNIMNFCKKIVPFIDFYKKQIDYYNKMVCDILTKEIYLILPHFQRKEKKRK